MLHFRTFRILLLLLAILPKVSFADLFTATQHYQQESYTEAYNEFYKLAEVGNGDAIYNLAVMSLYGQGTEKNLTLAYAYFTIAAEYGIAESQKTAQLIATQYPDKQALKQVLEQKRALFGYPFMSQKYSPNFTELTFSNDPIEKVYEKVPAYPEQAARQGLEGWVWLEFDVGVTGAVKNIKVIDSYPKNIFTSALLNAVSIWRYKANHPKKNHSLVYHFTTFKGKEYQRTLGFQQKDYRNEIKRHIDAAEQGNAQIQYYVANWLSSDKYNASQLLKYHWRDDTAHLTMLLAAAKNNYPIAQYKLAIELLSNTPSTHQFNVAVNWLYRSAKTFAPAQYKLATLYADSNNEIFAPHKATNWYKQAVAQDNRAAKALSLHLFKYSPNSPQITKWLETALGRDRGDPELLLLKAKLSKSNDPQKALRLAKTALRNAKERNWDVSPIQAFLRRE
ncbi:TonB family protein [Pseudoalteromonas luteoviolacea]|uniref:TonB family protein n=1 Tax=Pseudoalteromonas luteoviolacea TaxID=43657 RepID=UPI001B361D2C|nr:TonB family protein [Pseudoalteromonas luteoviolacea]MBQ4810859.1 TonB family protein [Pseudoalteromonas luteoviolacea]